ncbi:MAG: PEP-CTERM sorting domain-containing protein [Myxococcota bacterium]|nr:PEP-CTERM sorting domain-containing protein [Myxococcota bacterium]
MGGEAVAEAEAVNEAGPARAVVLATGGRGGSPAGGEADFGSGGDAAGTAYAGTSGDGHAVVVGAEEESGVFGGDASTFRFTTRPGGDGGSAASRSTGIAEGDSTVTVLDQATGGQGGGSSFPGGALGQGGDGGSASSSATATGNGTSGVMASANAKGGSGGSNVSELGVAGDADADASATGLGLVEANARALGGGFRVGSSVGERGGSGRAQASATGAIGFARAEAVTGEGAQQRYRALSDATLGSAASDVWARATFGEALGDVLPESGREGRSFLTGDPLEADVASALAGNDALAERFASEPSRMAALGQWGARNEGDEELVVTSELDVLLREAVASTLAIGAFGFESEGEGFTTLAFRVESFGVVLDEELFADLDEALAFFEDQLFEVDDAFGDDEDPPPLRLVFVATLARGDAFGMGLGFVVPEPSTASLLALGLVVLASRRRRHG